MSKRKAKSTEGPNHDICDFLLEIADFERNVERNTFKYNAYRKAASILAGQPERVKSGKDAKKLDGIGQKISDKIDEFLATGKIKKLEKIRANDENASINLLVRVSGIGPATAKKLVDKGITTIEGLRKHEDLLNHHQKIGLKYFEDFEKKIPREEIKKLENIIVKECKSISKKYLVTVCGSYRRGLAESGDIDVLLTHKDHNSSDPKKPLFLMNVIARLEEVGLLEETLSCGETKYMGVCRLKEKEKRNLHRRIDIMLIPHDQFFCAVLYFTGSNLFNQAMRAHAVEQGFTINEYCIRPLGSKATPGESLPVTSERDIFEYIDYPYKKPEERSI